MKGFSECFSKIANDFLVLNQEVATKLLKEKKVDISEKNKPSENNKRIMSSKRIEPLTRLRKDVDEAKNAKDNPETQFIIDGIKDIFGM